MQTKKTKFPLEQLKKHMRETTNYDEATIQGMALITLNNMGFATEEDYEKAFAQQLYEDAQKDLRKLNEYQKEAITELDKELEHICRKPDKIHRKEFDQRVMDLMSKGHTKDDSKFRTEAFMFGRYGDKYYGDQKQRQLDYLKDKHDYSDEDIEEVSHFMGLYGVNASQAVERLAEEQISNDYDANEMSYLDDEEVGDDDGEYGDSDSGYGDNDNEA